MLTATHTVYNIYQSNGACYDTCSSQYAYAVVQYQDCWCSNYAPANQSSTSQCSQDCPGYPAEQCGNQNEGLFGYIQLTISPSGTAGASASTTSIQVAATTTQASTSATSTPQSSTYSSTPTSVSPFLKLFSHKQHASATRDRQKSNNRLRFRVRKDQLKIFNRHYLTSMRSGSMFVDRSYV